MYLKFALLVVTATVLVSGGNVARASDSTTWAITNAEELVAAQQRLASSTDGDPVTLKVAAGTYLLKDSFRIGRSRTTLIAEPGTRFVLANNVNEPVLVIGSQKEYATPQDVISDVVVTGVEIDGNKERQSTEFSARRPWIRNNGIDARAVSRLTIARVVSSNNRSGGLVLSWGCSDVSVTDSTFAKNYFDGLAFYASTRVAVVGCTMKQNQAAGVSIDNDFVDSRFTQCVMESNGDVGIFARWCARLEFKDCTVQNSGNWAYFLAHDDKGRGVFEIAITGGQISGNRGGVCMASVTEKQSSGTRVVGASFSANEKNGRKNLQSSGAMLEAADLGDGLGKGPAVGLATIPAAIR